MDSLYNFVFNISDGTLKQHLQQSLLFKGFTSKELDLLAMRKNVRHYAKGQHVFFQGDPGSALYVILDGNVRIERHNGHTVPLANLTKGMFFGELAVIFESQRTASAFAVDDSILFCLFRHDIDNLMKYHPRIANKLLLNLAQILAQRLKTMNERIAK